MTTQLPPHHQPAPLLLQPLTQPVRNLGLAQLRQIVDALFAKGVDAPEVDHVLRRRLAASLHDNGGVRLEDDAVVDELVDQEGDEVVVFDYCPLVDGLPVGGQLA